MDALRSRNLRASSISPHEERELRRWCRTREAAHLRRIQGLVERGAIRNARKAARKFRGTLAGRLMALWRTAPDCYKSQPSLEWAEQELLRRAKLTEALRLLPAIASFARPARASVRLMPKRAGGHRLICSFDWADKARQRLLSQSMFPFASLHHSQFMLTPRAGGRGRAAACNALLQRLEDGEDDLVFLQVDVRNYFGTISHDWLERNLGMDLTVTRHHIHTGAMTFTMRDIATARPLDGELIELGRRGLPQGSALSSLVAEMAMADILRGLPAHLQDRLIVYSDNIGAAVPRSEGAAVEELIREAFRLHGAGPFETTSSVTRVTSEFKFLGYWWRVSDGTPQVFVPEIIAQNWAIEIGSRIAHASLEELPHLENVIKGKASAWRLWTGAALLCSDLLHQVQTARITLGGAEDDQLATLPHWLTDFGPD